MAWLMNEAQQEFLRQERRTLARLQEILEAIKADPDDRRALADSLEQLDDFFLLVVVGEFNAGKSALINALLGQPLLPEGVTPTTAQVQVLRYGPEEHREVLAPGLVLITLPAARLREMSIVDTPGTNAIIREHELLTTRFIPRADLVLFVTSADRAFSESERAFIEAIRDWGKALVLVLNKVDILDGPEALDELLTFVREQARQHLGLEPPVFPVSAKLALRAKMGEPALAQAAGLTALEAYIHQTLDHRERLRLKFRNPLGVGARLAARYLERLTAQQAALQDDLALLERMEGLLQVYQDDMRRQFDLRMAEMEKILLDMEARAQQYFDETIRIGRLPDLVRKKYLEQDFQARVIGDMPRQLEQRVESLIDWLVNAEMRQWESLLEQVARQQARHRERLGASLQTPFFARREQLMTELRDRARRVLATYDRQAEAQRLAEGTRTAVAAAAGIGVGAVGLGALVVALATTVAMDVTGVLAAGVMFTLGLLIIPARRRQASAEMHRRVQALRQTLSQALRQQFEHEIQRSVEHFREALAPYTRFVRAEQQRLQTHLEQLQAVHGELETLQARLEQVV